MAEPLDSAYLVAPGWVRSILLHPWPGSPSVRVLRRVLDPSPPLLSGYRPGFGHHPRPCTPQRLHRSLCLNAGAEVPGADTAQPARPPSAEFVHTTGDAAVGGFALVEPAPADLSPREIHASNVRSPVRGVQ